jgi:hypothetical protein
MGKGTKRATGRALAQEYGRAERATLTEHLQGDIESRAFEAYAVQDATQDAPVADRVYASTTIRFGLPLDRVPLGRAGSGSVVPDRELAYIVDVPIARSILYTRIVRRTVALLRAEMGAVHCATVEGPTAIRRALALQDRARVTVATLPATAPGSRSVALVFCNALAEYLYIRRNDPSRG